MTSEEMFNELGYDAEFPIGTHFKNTEEETVAICVFQDEVYKTSSFIDKNRELQIYPEKFTPDEIKAIAKAIEEMEEK